MATLQAGLLYDVFLCHNSRDKAAVRTINEALRQEYGLSTYLDEATLVGGEAWESSVQGALAAARACAVIVGPHGWGPYQLTHEARPAVRRRDAEPAFRVIPVLLPGANVEPLADFAELFSRSHWITFQSADEASTVRALAFAIRGEHAFPEGPPRLSVSRVRFDAIRWDVSSRRDLSLLYGGRMLREATALLENAGEADPTVGAFLAAGDLHHNQRLAGQLAAHASVMWNNPRQRDLAARLALESTDRAATAEGIAVLRKAYAGLHRTIRRLSHPAAVTAASVDATREKLATGCDDGSVGVWDGSTLRRRGRHPASVRAVVDLGGDRFATADAGGAVIVWSWSGDDRLAQFGTDRPIARMDARQTPEGTVLLTSGGIPGQPGEVVVWNAADGTARWRTGMVTDAAFDADGSHVALAWGDHVALRLVSGGALAAKQPMDAPVIAVATHPTHPLVAATTFDRRTCLVSFAADPPARHELAAGTSRVSPVRISPDGLRVAAVRDDFRIVVCNLADGTRQLLKYEGLLNVDLRFSDQGRYLGVLSPESAAITVWSAASGQHVCTIEQESPAVALFDDRRNALWTASDGTVAALVELPRQDDALATGAPGLTTALAFGPDGRTLAWTGTPVGRDLRVAAGTFGLLVFDAPTGRLRLEAALSEPCTIVFDRQGDRVAAIGAAGATVWDLASGTEAPAPAKPFWPDPAGARGASAQTLLEPPAVAAACAQRGRADALASEDGRFVAIDHGKQFVSLWAAPATEIAAFSMTAEVQRMAFSAGGELFAAGDARGQVMVWQTDGICLGQLQHDEPISYLTFSPDGSYLAVASLDAALRVWIVASGLLAASVKEKVGGTLSAEEWTRYLGDEPRREEGGRLSPAP